jgi:hypothetical protein
VSLCKVKVRDERFVARLVGDMVVDTWEWVKGLDREPLTKGKVGLDPHIS